MEKTLHPNFHSNTNGWKEMCLSLKNLSFTCFVSAFVFLMGLSPAEGFAAPAEPTSFTATAATDVKINLSLDVITNNDSIVVIFNTTGDGDFSGPNSGDIRGDSGTVFAGGIIVYKGKGGDFSHTDLTAN